MKTAIGLAILILFCIVLVHGGLSELEKLDKGE